MTGADASIFTCIHRTKIACNVSSRALAIISWPPYSATYAPEVKTNMAVKRHTPDEIIAKLQQADEMAARGKTQHEISRALGISIMTYHRWRKLRDKQASVSSPSLGKLEPETIGPPSETTDSARLAELQIENARLRRLITDLLLEKMKLQEELERREDANRRRRG